MDVPLIYVDTEQFYSLIISPNLKLFYMARLLKRKSRNAFLFTQKNINNSYPSTFFCLSWILPGSIPMTSLKGFLKHIFTKMNFQIFDKFLKFIKKLLFRRFFQGQGLQWLYCCTLPHVSTSIKFLIFVNGKTIIIILVKRKTGFLCL